MRDLFNDTKQRDRESMKREKKSITRQGFEPNNILVTRQALHQCATTAAQEEILQFEWQLNKSERLSCREKALFYASEVIVIEKLALYSHSLSFRS